MDNLVKKLLLVAPMALAAANAEAVMLPMTLDSSQSSISISVVFGASPFVPQGPGSTTANYSGSILVDVDDLLAPTSIQILGSSAAASITGQWLPEAGGGPAVGDPGMAQDANYGFFLNLGALGQAWIALRDVVFDVTNGAEAVAGGSFASTQTLEVASALFAFNVPAAFGGPGQDDLTGDTLTNASATMSTYNVVGSTATLTIPIDIVDQDDLSVIYSGQLVATARVPEPSSLALAGAMLAGVIGMVAVARRRQ